MKLSCTAIGRRPWFDIMGLSRGVLSCFPDVAGDIPECVIQVTRPDESCNGLYPCLHSVTPISLTCSLESSHSEQPPEGKGGELALSLEATEESNNL